MYLRHTTVRRKGKTHTYWKLVRSVRQGGRVHQEVVAHLGRLDAPAKRKASSLARHFLGPDADQPSLFEDDRDLPVAPVRLDDVRVERGRGFGDVWLAWLLWQALGLDKFCEKHLARGREEVPWHLTAAILVIARLCEPSSELHIAEDWYRRTALEDILGVPDVRVHHKRLYEGLDQRLKHKHELQKHIKERLGGLFALDYDLLLYDVTSTYFEGEAKRNPLAQRGYSRDHRGDCKQVCIGLIVSREGYPLGYEVFAGNRVDVTTVEEIVEKIEGEYGKAGRVWVMDRGMSSESNLEWLREGGRQYLIGTPRTEMKKWAQAEAAFRINKSELSLRPIWHQREDRVQAHILVCFLAFCLWKTLEGWQARAGLGNSPRTVLEEMARIQCVDVVLPVEDGPELRLRCVARPDQAQAALLDRLGLQVPKRLRVPTAFTEM